MHSRTETTLEYQLLRQPVAVGLFVGEKLRDTGGVQAWMRDCNSAARRRAPTMSMSRGLPRRKPHADTEFSSGYAATRRLMPLVAQFRRFGAQHPTMPLRLESVPRTPDHCVRTSWASIWRFTGREVSTSRRRSTPRNSGASAASCIRCSVAASAGRCGPERARRR